MKTKNDSNLERALKPRENQWMEFLHLGWIFAGTLTLTLGIGIGLDQHFQTQPIFLLIGTVFGFIGCGYSLYRVILKIEQTDHKKT